MRSSRLKSTIRIIELRRAWSKKDFGIQKVDTTSTPSLNRAKNVRRAESFPHEVLLAFQLLLFDQSVDFKSLAFLAFQYAESNYTIAMGEHEMYFQHPPLYSILLFRARILCRPGKF